MGAHLASGGFGATPYIAWKGSVKAYRKARDRLRGRAGVRTLTIEFLRRWSPCSVAAGRFAHMV